MYSKRKAKKQLANEKLGSEERKEQRKPVVWKASFSLFIKQPSKINPTHLLNFLPSSTKKKIMTKCGQIVAKYDPNMAKFGHTGLSGP